MTHKPDAVELKPCPFCGNAEPKLGWSCETTDQHDFDFGYYPTQPPREAEWSIECECRFETGGYFSPQIVADLWNTRDTAELDALRRKAEAGKQAAQIGLDTLIAMRDADYRGNRPTSSESAFHAVKAINKALEGGSR